MVLRKPDPKPLDMSPFAQKLLLVIILLFVVFVRQTSAQTEFDSGQPIPILAYYYIWFEENSWERAKTDYPLLGNYSSDDRSVMEQHVQWARQAGIDGFIVSWKHTEILDPRLAMLVEIAAENDFKLVMIYQGLDFERDPLPAARVKSDMEWFAENYAESAVFNLFGKPTMIWSGTWKFSLDDIEVVSRAVRQKLLLLGTERNVEGYLRLADHLDGNAYYWSSVNPETYSRYQEKLTTMSDEIHARGGLWIAPAAPGFDARLVGGTSVVERRDGLTMQYEMQVAFNSTPDAVGLISWNEFSENTHIEPSQKYNMRYIEILADFNEIILPMFDTFNSSDPPISKEETADLPITDMRGSAVVLVSGILLVLLLGISVVQRRK